MANTYTSIYTGAQIDSLVKKTGDTMTGNLMLDGRQIDIKTQIPNNSTLPSSNLISPALRFRSSDDSDLAIGYVQSYKYTDGKQGITLAGRQQINGSNVTNYAKLWVDNTGTCGVTLSTPDAWKEALDIDDLENVCLQYRTTNPTTTATDTQAVWKAKKPGVYYYNASGGVNGQPGVSGFLIHIVVLEDEIFQIWLDQSNKTRLYVRGANSYTTTMPEFTPQSMTPGVSGTVQNVSFSLNITSATSTWQTFLSNFTAPSNGYLRVYFNGAITSPAAILTDKTNGFGVRENGNGGRDFEIYIPCAKGHNYSGECVSCKTSYMKFYPTA